MLYGLALPKDMEQLPKELVPSFKDMCSFLVQVAAERERYHDELKAERNKNKSLEKQYLKEKAKNQQLQGELFNSKSEVEGYQKKLKDVEEAEARKIDEADTKGFQEGMEKAAAQYRRDARRMVNMELEKRLGPCWTEGFKAGVVAHAERYQADTNDDIINGLPLPYTAEETAPLPSDDEEEVEEGVDEAADGREEIINIEENVAAGEPNTEKQVEVVGTDDVE